MSKLGILPNVELKLPVINRNPNLNPFWISGLTTGEGSVTYFTRTRKNSKNETVKDFTLVMEVAQDSKDGVYLNLNSKLFWGRKSLSRNQWNN